jgi:hypothetical protein
VAISASEILLAYGIAAPIEAAGHGEPFGRGRLRNQLHDRFVISGSPRQFEEMKENRRCSTLFHLLVPGGKWQTRMVRRAHPPALKAPPSIGAVGSRCCRLRWRWSARSARSDRAAGLPRASSPRMEATAKARCRGPSRRSRSRCCGPGRRCRTDTRAVPRVGKVVHLHVLLRRLRFPPTPRVLAVAEQFLLLGVDRNDRPLRSLADLVVDKRNCASRSGCSVPSSVFRFPCRL